jgi:tRNA modification GTPase
MTCHKIVVFNKVDLPGWQGDRLASCIRIGPHAAISAISGEGVDALVSLMAERLGGEAQGETAVLTTARQHRAVADSLEFVKKGAYLLNEGGEPELVAAELKWARETLSALLGKSATKEMLDVLFSEFCIGK